MAVIRCWPAWASAPAKGNDLYHEMIESNVNIDPKKNGSTEGSNAPWSMAR